MKVIQQLNSRATQDGDGVNISRIPGFDAEDLSPSTNAYITDSEL